MGYSILIVDDSALTRAFIKRTLAAAGFEIETCYEATDGITGLDMLRANKVDLIMIDLHMPNMDGSEMARRILADEQLRETPIVIVSADPNSDRLQELQLAGVAGFIRKPFTPELFRDAVQPIFGALHV